MDLEQFNINRSTLAQKIYDYYVRTNKDWRRPHLGASIIGRPCSREIWYSFHWVQAPGFDGRMLRLFETGQRFEDRICSELEGIGIKITERQKVIVIFPHFGGSIDGLGEGFEESKKIHLLEFKTHNQKSFDKLLNHGVDETKPEHVVQMNIYMGGLKKDRAYYIAENKNTSEIYAERVKYESTIYNTNVEKAHAIIDSPVPPTRICDNPARFACQFCSYKNICHGQSCPEVNCRTCLHSTPEPDGTWSCARHGADIPVEFQKVGCEDHLFIPQLLNREVIDATDSSVIYEGWTNKNNSMEYVDIMNSKGL